MNFVPKNCLKRPEEPQMRNYPADVTDVIPEAGRECEGSEGNGRL